VEQAGGEGDADVMICKKAIQLGETHQRVCIMADDTDILVLLI
jgi:hypothetical protein